MSITYCHNCNKNIDTDFDATHIEDCVATDPLEHIANTSKKIKEKLEDAFNWEHIFGKNSSSLNEMVTFIEILVQEAYKKGYIDGGLNK